MATAIGVLPSLTDSPPISLIHYPSLIDQPTLAELDHLVRVKDYYAQRDSVSRIQLHQIILANALIARLIWALYRARGLLVEMFNAEDASAYATLNQSVDSLQKSIQETCSPVSDTSIITRFDYSNKENSASTPRTFLDELSPTAAFTIVKFMENIRNHSSILSNRLSSVYPNDLEALVRWNPYNFNSPSGWEKNTLKDSRSDHIMSFHRHDPLYILTCVIFAPPSSDFSTLEDVRRLHVWSTVFARMVSERKGESFCLALLDTWGAMAEWTGSLRFEQALFVILQDGAILSSRSDDADRKDFETESSDSSSEADARTTFFNSAILRLLKVLNSEGGLPFGAVKFGQAVFAKLAKDDVQYFESFVVSKWFFHNFLRRAVIHPENYGLFGDYHLSDDQRNQLLKPLHNRLYYAADSVISRHHLMSNSHEELVQVHIEGILKKFSGTSEILPTRPLLLSSAETCSNIQPTIVLCPSDILTTFYALYPQFKSETITPLAQVPTGFRPARYSSNGSSFSLTSDIIKYSEDPLRTAVTNQQRSDVFSVSGSNTSESERSSQSAITTPYEPEEGDDEVYSFAVKGAIDEMRRRLGPDCAGKRHPCEERWAPIYVSFDGGKLSLEPDFDVVSGTKGVTVEPVELVVNHDIDATIEASLMSLLHDSPRSTILSSSRPTLGLFNPLSDSSQVFSSADENLMLLSQRDISPIQEQPIISSYAKSPLLDALTAASRRCYARGQFIQAQNYMHCAQVMQEIESPSLTKNDYASVLGIIARRIQGRSNVHLNHVRAHEVWFSYALQERAILHRIWDDEKACLSRLRCKIWYIDYVRETSQWDRAKGVCSALERMRKSSSGSTSSSPPVPELRRNSSILSLQLVQRHSMSKVDNSRFHSTRNSVEVHLVPARPASLYNVSTGGGSEGWFDILAAPEEQGGPHKLADVQVDVTKKWLQENGVFNFCNGEELIHRFAAEIDDLIRRVLPDEALDTRPVSTIFWENCLFLEDAKALNMCPETSSSTLPDKGAQVTISRKDGELPRSLGADIFNLFGKTRSKTLASDVPRPDIRCLCPSCASTTSATLRKDISKRPRFSHSVSFPNPSKGSFKSALVTMPSHMTHSKKEVNIKIVDEFLDRVRTQITSLVLSDLGGSMWAIGSETDEWFSGNLGERWLTSNFGDKPQLHGLISKDGGTRNEKSFQPSSKEVEAFSEASIGFIDSSQRTMINEKSNIPIKLRSGMDYGSQQFLFQESYQYLIERFSVHPSPQQKLQALFEMETLVEAALTRSQRLREKLEVESQTPPTFLDQSIVASRLPGDSVAAISSRSSTSGTDDLIGQLRTILRDPNTRSKTLFRDLTFVSSFVSAVTLTHAGQGKVFWDFGAAALSLKSDAAKAMAQWYDEIMHGRRREEGELKAPSHSRKRSQFIVMEEAARMLVIAAKEGVAIAQRELALLHLSEPSILTLSSQPLSQPSNTFHSVYCKKDPFTNKDKYDPYRIALAKHWMGLAAEAGDSYALSAINDDYFDSL